MLFLIKTKKILLILLAICEAYKDDPTLRSLINDYHIEFDNKNYQ
jgi:hypothetical protein